MDTQNGTVSAVQLLEIDPDLGVRLSPDEREVFSRLKIPLRSTFSGEFDLDRTLAENDSFALLVADGVLIHEMSLGEQPGLRLLGPGDLITRASASRSTLPMSCRYRASGLVSFGLLGERMLMAIQRFPRLVEGLQMRCAEQHQRLAMQMLICQQPRVEDRVLALMWLLADTWGRVTASGTSLPLRLTHDTIGACVGARRPTVTLALKELAGRGALVRQGSGWLLLARPDLGEHPLRPAAPSAALELVRTAHSPWAPQLRLSDDAPAEPPVAQPFSETFQSLRLRHLDSREQIRHGLARASQSRQRSRELLAEIARARSARERLHHDDDPRDSPVRAGS